jgi:hypothetical protein
VHAPPHMTLLTELGGFAGGVVAIDMALLTELDDPRRPGGPNCATSHAAFDGALSLRP